MKKILFLLLGMIGIPCLICIFVCVMSPELSIGQGEKNMKTCRMGKEILVEIDGLYKQMDVEEYVLGILAGVISPDYDEEALKVQAVLVRTNLLKEMQERGTRDGEDIPYTYISVEERKQMWGERNYEKNERKLERAVIETAGKVLEQEGNLILAFYHEVSIGKTASAKEILDEEISYLQSVESNSDVEAKHYMNLVEYSWDEVKDRVDSYIMAVEDSEKEQNQTDQQSVEENNPEEMQSSSNESIEEKQDKIEIEIAESTENGFVKKVNIGGSAYTGEEIMEMFDLPSMNFYAEAGEEGVRFVCLGKGNCLGVSQYGANCMAKSGKTMEEILDYYYKDVSLKPYKEDA